MTTEAAVDKPKNNQLDFLAMIPKETPAKKEQFSIADEVESSLRERYLLRQGLARRMFLKGISVYGTLNLGILAGIIAHEMGATYDEKTGKEEAAGYINGTQLPLELYPVIRTMELRMLSLSYSH